MLIAYVASSGDCFHTSPCGFGFKSGRVGLEFLCFPILEAGG